jgi:hypothetical protein
VTVDGRALFFFYLVLVRAYVHVEVHVDAYYSTGWNGSVVTYLEVKSLTVLR